MMGYCFTADAENTALPWRQEIDRTRLLQVVWNVHLYSDHC